MQPYSLMFLHPLISQYLLSPKFSTEHSLINNAIEVRGHLFSKEYFPSSNVKIKYFSFSLGTQNNLSFLCVAPVREDSETVYFRDA